MNSLDRLARFALVPSQEQSEIISAVEHVKENILIQACAGSGKTATLQMICAALPSRLKVLVVCFNRSVAVELGEHMPLNVHVRTIDSLGFEILKNSLRVKIHLKNDKPKAILDDYCKGLRDFDWEEDKLASFRKHMIPLLDRVRETMTDADDKKAVRELADQLGFDVPESTIEHLPVMLAFNRVQRSIISFADMTDHVVHHNLSFPEYSVVLIDEAQDLNLLQIEFLRRLVQDSNARVIAVGDRHQAIYGWRGADSQSMKRIQEVFECEEYPLSVCFRCSRAVIRSAQEIVGVDSIRAADSASEGLVLDYEPGHLAETLESLVPGDMVLCRTNAPLVSVCLDVIRSGRNASILGRDVGEMLIALASEIIGGRVLQRGAFLNALRRYALIQIERLQREKKNGALTNFENMLQALCSFVVAGVAPSELETQIAIVFREDSTGIIFSTIHRAKGLEADTVVLLGPELIPHPMATTREALQQESNLNYVARTRARETLLFQPLRD